MATDVSPKPEREPTYLGAGVYVHFDGYQVWLRTQREFGWHEIALEPNCWVRLKEFVEGLDNPH